MDHQQACRAWHQNGRRAHCWDVEEDIIFAVNELKSRTDYLLPREGLARRMMTSHLQLSKSFWFRTETNQTAVDMLRAYYETDEQLTPARLKWRKFR